MTCGSLRNVASELALDMLTGDERGAALEHLETCSACRQDVALLTDAAEELLVLAPEVEPSAGFEPAVLARIQAAAQSETTPPAQARAHNRRWSNLRRVLAVAAAFVMLLSAGLIAVARSDHHEAATRTTNMRSTTGPVVGTVALAADPASITLSIPDWIALVQSYGATVDAPYWLTVQTADGSRDIHRLPGADEQPWHVALDVDANSITAVSVVDNKGAVWCTARFSA